MEGLSGLLHGFTGVLQNGKRGDSGKLAEEKPRVQGSAWRQPAPKAELPKSVQAQPVLQQEPVAAEENTAAGEQSNEMLHKLTLIAMLIAGIFFVLTVVLAVFQLIGAAVVFLIIALLAAAGGVAGLLLAHR